MGWWSMLFERLQYQLKKTCKTPKSHEKHVVLEHVRRDFIQDLNNRKMQLNNNNQPYTFDFSDSFIEIIGKSSICKHPAEKKALCDHFVQRLRSKSPDQAEDLLKHFNLSLAVIKRYNKIRCGNCIFEIEFDPKIQNSKYYKRKFIKQTCDYYVQIRNKDTPTKSSIFFDPTSNQEFPTFGRCKMIYSIEPFFSGPLREKVYYYFKCEELNTVGFHRSLWTIDDTETSKAENSISFLDPESLCQLQVMVAQHGDLPDGKLSVMRLGRDVITYAPIEP